MPVVKLKLTGTNWSTAANEFCCSVFDIQDDVSARDRCDYVGLTNWLPLQQSSNGVRSHNHSSKHTQTQMIHGVFLFRPLQQSESQSGFWVPYCFHTWNLSVITNRIPAVTLVWRGQGRISGPTHLFLVFCPSPLLNQSFSSDWKN